MDFFWCEIFAIGITGEKFSQLELVGAKFSHLELAGTKFSHLALAGVKFLHLALAGAKFLHLAFCPTKCSVLEFPCFLSSKIKLSHNKIKLKREISI